LPELRFCPTGGITRDNAAEFLKLPNVICVGGSWVAPADALAEGNWTRIAALSRDAAQLGRGP
jgi:2-dehydro-3-deoxyphosphogluconate aldolase/(4S)-4-hydroxy-2-oxoglutarate aldolase